MIIALVCQKGGAGKTSLALAFGWELHKRGEDVLLVDADPQRSVCAVGEKAAELGLDCPRIMAAGKDLREQLTKNRRGARYVIIDTPGGRPNHYADAIIPRAAMSIADVVLVPVGQSPLEAWVAAQTTVQVAEALALRPDLIARLVVTKTKPWTVLGRNAREANSGLDFQMLDAGTTNRIVWEEAPAAGMGVTAYAPEDAASEEARAVLDEVLSLKKGRKR